MNKLTVVQTFDEWEGLFINGVLFDQGETLNKAEHYLSYCKQIFDTYSPCEIEFKRVTDKYNKEYLDIHGSFPENLNEVEYE